MRARRSGSRCSPPLSFGSFALAVLLTACGASHRATLSSHGGGHHAEPLPIERVVVDDRPPLTLVARTGDPQAAVAFVARHSRGAAASAALSGLLLARLEALGLKAIEARANGLGVEVSQLVSNEADVRTFFSSLRRVLGAPVSGDEPGLQRARRELGALNALRFAGPGEATAALCSGDLGIGEGTPPLDLGTPQGLAALEAARAASFRVEAAAFGALAPEELLSEAEDALEDSDRWPTEPADPDTWPERDLALVDQEKGSRQLSLALWVPDANAAVGAGVLLGGERSDLMNRLGTLTPPWRLTRAVAIARHRGACLRLDLTPPDGDPGPSAGDVGRVAALVEASAVSALGRAVPGAIEESVLRPSDPRRAAVLAAWRALPTAREDAERRTIVAYISGPSDTLSSAELTAAVGEARGRLARPTIELSERIERGQGEIWMLAASPCGTTVEASADAGAFALLLRALARGTSAEGVRFEPWVTPDGVGLLAHGPRAAPSEGAINHANRVAAALGRALTARLEGVSLGGARAQLLNELGGRSFAGFALALDGLSPAHPSWLEPRGLWQTLTDLPTEALERARRLLLSSPVRLSVLANAPDQGRVAAAELESWLLPFRAEPRGCPSTRVEPQRRGQAKIDATQDTLLEGAYVGVTVGPPGVASARTAELAAFLLNRSGGWLERALVSVGQGATARAHALGGTRRPALLIDVRALPERMGDAVGRVRSVLDQLARGAVSNQELRAAAKELTLRNAQAQFDPRRRIVELWRGESQRDPDLASVRTALASLGHGSHWVVTVERAP